MSTATPRSGGVRAVLREWILAATPESDAAGLTDTTPIIGDRYLTSLQITDLILFIEDLRGVPVEIDELTPGTFRDIETIHRTFFGGTT